MSRAAPILVFVSLLQTIGIAFDFLLVKHATSSNSVVDVS